MFCINTAQFLFCLRRPPEQLSFRQARHKKVRPCSGHAFCLSWEVSRRNSDRTLRRKAEKPPAMRIKDMRSAGSPAKNLAASSFPMIHALSLFINSSALSPSAHACLGATAHAPAETGSPALICLKVLINMRPARTGDYRHDHYIDIMAGRPLFFEH